MRITIISAAYQEESSIAATLDDLAAHLPAGSEILVVDGGSDRTGEIVRKLAASRPGLRHIAHHGDRGKGHAVRTGMDEASGGVQVQFDADGQFLASDIAKLIAPLLAGEADLVLGSRFLTNHSRGGSVLRTLGNRVISAWAGLLFGRRTTDVLAGLKAWRAEAVPVIRPASDGFEYEVEIPARALRGGLRVCEVAVGTRERAAGESKVAVIRTGAKILWACLRFRCQQFV
jgi:glycosyltransferase involved in cell wall biosynthesis